MGHGHGEAQATVSVCYFFGIPRTFITHLARLCFMVDKAFIDCRVHHLKIVLGVVLLPDHTACPSPTTQAVALSCLLGWEL